MILRSQEHMLSHTCNFKTATYKFYKIMKMFIHIDDTMLYMHKKQVQIRYGSRLTMSNLNLNFCVHIQHSVIYMCEIFHSIENLYVSLLRLHVCESMCLILRAKIVSRGRRPRVGMREREKERSINLFY